MTFSSKERFLQNKTLAGKHRNLMVDPDFLTACEAAVQHHSDIETANAGPDPVAAAARFHRIAGARAFVGVLLNLGEVVIVPERPEKPKLNYNA